MNIPFILQVAGVLAALLGPSMSLAPSGPLLAAFKSALPICRSPESLTSVSSSGFTLLPRYKAITSLALKGQRVALFKTQCVLSCNSNYFGYRVNKHAQ
ncbi:hypothetical protein FGI00_14655 [Dickeya zeae]|nr:hypothetical protein FGI00_14655 [Dickeya zeae]